MSFILPRTEWWFVPGAMIVIWLCLQFGELITCVWATRRRSRRKFDWTAQITKKIASWFLLMGPIALDVLTHLIPELLSRVDMPLLSDDRFLPFTCTALVMFITSEGYNLAINVAAIQGKDSEAWIVVKMFAFVQFINQMRWRASGRMGDAPERWTDKLDPAKIAMILEHLDADSSMTPERFEALLREAREKDA
jgi:hypothetical protein